MFSLNNYKTALKMDGVVSVGEITRWPDLLKAEPTIIEKLEFALQQGKRIDGHTAGFSNRAINALVALGVTSCHEPINSNQVLDRLRLGMWVMLRNSSIRPDLSSILSDLIEKNISFDRVMMTNDGAEPTFLSRNGFTDGLIKTAVGLGLDPVTAIKMVTLNPAVSYGLDSDIGGIAPGRYADILFFKNLKEFSPDCVMVKGKMAICNGISLQKTLEDIDWNKMGFKSNYLKPQWLERVENLAALNGRVPIIKLVSSGITKLDFLEWNGSILPENLNYCCLLGRQGEYLTTCFIEGFADSIEGLASSFTTSMGILVIGHSLESMRSAVFRLNEIGGGIIVWEGISVKYELSLEIGGMMSSLDFDKVVSRLDILYNLMFTKGFFHNDLLLSLIFLSCDFLPTVRITPQGVLNVKNQKIIYTPKI